MTSVNPVLHISESLLLTFTTPGNSHKPDNTTIGGNSTRMILDCLQSSLCVE
jgi:hypothetical protein